MAKKLIALLAPFQEATTILSGNSYVTASVVRPILDHVLRQLDGMRYQAQADDEMELQLGCDEEDNDPNVTESAVKLQSINQSILEWCKQCYQFFAMMKSVGFAVTTFPL